MSGQGITLSDRRTLIAATACVGVGYILWRNSRNNRPPRNHSQATAVVSRPRSHSMTLTSLQNAMTWSRETGEEKNMVRVMVPATSANMGSGFDTLGMAVDMWNELKLERASEFSIHVEGEGKDDVPYDESNLVVVGVKTVFEAIGVEMPTLRFSMINRIPHGRGLGSSSAAIVAGLLAGLAIAGRKLDIIGTEKMLQLGLKLEGHPDNIAPALYGGVQLGIFSERAQRWMTNRVPLPHGLIFVIFIPTFTGKTSELRRVVPKTIPISDAVYNMGRVGWLLSCLLTGQLKDVREGFDDRLHQNQRGAAVYPYLCPMIEAAYEAGALGAYLSGSGPCVMAITAGGTGDFFTQCDTEHRKDGQVASAMSRVAKDMAVDGKVYITHPAHTGGVVVEADPPFSSHLVAFNGYT